MRFLITAGPTREPLDPVRYLSNRSSGKMGYAIAEATLEAGHEVVLISGPVGINRPRGAAVIVSKSKIKKRDGSLSFDLIPTRDILASLPKNRKYIVVGFAAETENVETNALKKLREKKCDIVVANDVSRADSGMESDENEVTILFRGGEIKKISRGPKKIVARELIKIFANVCEKRLTKKIA